MKVHSKSNCICNGCKRVLNGCDDGCAVPTVVIVLVLVVGEMLVFIYIYFCLECIVPNSIGLLILIIPKR